MINLKRPLIYFLFSVLLIVSCKNNSETTMMDQNPLLKPFDTPFEVPPFDLIKNKHYLPAFTSALKEHKEEIEKIINNPDKPDFSNTIEALDRSGRLLSKVSSVFYNLRGAHTNDSLQNIDIEVTPLLSAHADEILMNKMLFERIREVYTQIDSLDLGTEEKTLLTKYYRDFKKGGAELSEEDKNTLKKINQDLAMLELQFGDNVLKEDNDFKLWIEDSAGLAGLPENVVRGAKDAAVDAGEEGKWLFTLHKPSLIPFLTYSEDRPMREKMFKAYIHRGDNNNKEDNKKIISKVISLRYKKARLLGYPNYAAMILEDNMAQNSENVYKMLWQIWEPALEVAKEEAKDLQALITAEGQDFNLEPWDWWYYTEKLKKHKYDLDEGQLRPYFQLEKVLEGIFLLSEKLYGIKVVPRPDLPKYHEDVKVVEIQEQDGSHIGIMYLDYFPRASKRGGAWMNSYRKQSYLNDKKITPVICNVGNFSKPVGDKPALLSFEEVTTMFHEFGHALHGLLSDCKFRSLSGTSVPRDFVELPSQIMENWASEPELLEKYAFHYQTGEVIPIELLDKMKESSRFNQGFETVEFMAAAFLDMDWHMVESDSLFDVDTFEEQSMNKIGMIPEIVVRYRSTNFRHIFAGGYSAGYYSYLWSEMLDADAYAYFKENGIFNKEIAESFRTNILARGGSDEPINLYKKFRGQPPTIDALLARKGFQ